MLICFGVSWPISIAKAVRTKHVRGKSRLFMSLILLGYASGILHKYLNPPASGSAGLAPYVIWLYAFNFAMVAIDLTLYMKYKDR